MGDIKVYKRTADDSDKLLDSPCASVGEDQVISSDIHVSSAVCRTVPPTLMASATTSERKQMFLKSGRKFRSSKSLEKYHQKRKEQQQIKDSYLPQNMGITQSAFLSTLGLNSADSSRLQSAAVIMSDEVAGDIKEEVSFACSKINEQNNSSCAMVTISPEKCGQHLTSPRTPNASRTLMSQLSREGDTGVSKWLSFSFMKEDVDRINPSDGDEGSGEGEGDIEGSEEEAVVKGSSIAQFLLLKIPFSSALGQRSQHLLKDIANYNVIKSYEEYCDPVREVLVYEKLRYRPVDVNFRRRRRNPSHWCHLYKFNKADTSEFKKTCITGMNKRSRKLAKCLKHCRVNISKLKPEEVRFWQERKTMLEEVKLDDEISIMIEIPSASLMPAEAGVNQSAGSNCIKLNTYSVNRRPSIIEASPSISNLQHRNLPTTAGDPTNRVIKSTPGSYCEPLFLKKNVEKQFTDELSNTKINKTLYVPVTSDQFSVSNKRSRGPHQRGLVPKGLLPHRLNASQPLTSDLGVHSWSAVHSANDDAELVINKHTSVGNPTAGNKVLTKPAILSSWYRPPLSNNGSLQLRPPSLLGMGSSQTSPHFITSVGQLGALTKPRYAVMSSNPNFIGVTSTSSASSTVLNTTHLVSGDGHFFNYHNVGTTLTISDNDDSVMVVDPDECVPFVPSHSLYLPKTNPHVGEEYSANPNEINYLQHLQEIHQEATSVKCNQPDIIVIDSSDEDG